MYNNTSMNMIVIDSAIILPICFLIVLITCSIGRYICISRVVVKPPPPCYSEIEHPPPPVYNG